MAAMMENVAVDEIMDGWSSFCLQSEALLRGGGEVFDEMGFIGSVHGLCKHGLLVLVRDHFLHNLEKNFKGNGVSQFWQHLDDYFDIAVNDTDESYSWRDGLQKSVEELCILKRYQEKCLTLLDHALQSYSINASIQSRKIGEVQASLLPKYQLMVSSVLLTTLPQHFPEMLHLFFKKGLEELSEILCGAEATSTRGVLIQSIGTVVCDLRSLGFSSMAENAYASAIFYLLKAKVHDFVGDDYRSPVLESVRKWIQDVPLCFLCSLLSYLGEQVEVSDDYGSSDQKSPLASCPSSCFPGINVPSEGLVRWQLRLEYCAYETIQDLRISKLFEIIVDYPDSSPAIEDLRQCLEHTGQHSKLVDSFISALRYRLLTAGASTNDILHQYVSTIKALRAIDPTGVFLEAVGEPIREYLGGRKDTIKCIVTMLTDGSGGNSNGPGNSGDSLLEELNRDAENQETLDYDDDIYTDDKQAWINCQRWEPDPVEADSLKGGRKRRKVDILDMLVNIIGSKEQLVNEYRVILAEKLLNKSDYDIDSEIRTLELLKIHFGESSMQRCEIMLNDLIDSKRTNGNIKATIGKQLHGVNNIDDGISLDVVDATIISSSFWPPIQAEALNIPNSVDQLLHDFAKRFHDIKTPRKLIWMKNLGTVKLELEFEDRSVEFTVSPMHATIIMQFQDQPCWTSKNLAAAIGVPVDILNRKITFWVSKGILIEALGADPDDHVFTMVNEMVDTNRIGTNGSSCEEVLVVDEGETCVASAEEQLWKEMAVFEKFIFGMLTNFGSMALDRIHNTLKMFCAEPSYDKPLQQLQSFLSGLIAEEKLELRDGMYFLKK